MRIVCTLGMLLRISFWLVVVAVMIGVFIANLDLPRS